MGDAPIIIEPLLKEKDANSLFIGHLKRFHLHKRQLMTVLGLINHYIDLKESPEPSFLVPRVHFFAGKASPESITNKAIIHLINRVK